MSLQTRLNSLITTIKTETKALRVLISGTNNGDVSALTTASTNLVSAINEVKAIADGAASGNVSINDTAASTTEVYSSSKTMAEITAQIATALEGEDLSDLADAVAANAANDLNLATAASVTALEAIVNNKANASDVYTQAELGNPETDLVALWNAA